MVLTGSLTNTTHLANVITCSSCCKPSPEHRSRITVDKKGKKKCKGSLYIAQYPVRWTAQCVVHVLPPPPDIHVHSDTNSASPGSRKKTNQFSITTFSASCIAKSKFLLNILQTNLLPRTDISHNNSAYRSYP